MTIREKKKELSLTSSSIPCSCRDVNMTSSPIATVDTLKLKAKGNVRISSTFHPKYTFSDLR